jgi:peroxiredoxin
MLKPGDKAPDFTLLDQHGEPFSLSKSLKARKVLDLIYFYPKGMTLDKFSRCRRAWRLPRPVCGTRTAGSITPASARTAT